MKNPWKMLSLPDVQDAFDLMLHPNQVQAVARRYDGRSRTWEFLGQDETIRFMVTLSRHMGSCNHEFN